MLVLNGIFMQGRYWILTIPRNDWQVPDVLPENTACIQGQAERGNVDGYEHWQIVVGFTRSTRLAGVKRIFGLTAHCELTRSEAALAYVQKEDTRIEGTQFKLGRFALKRNCAHDWDTIKDLAKSGRMDEVPSDVYIRHYSTLCRIGQDHQKPAPMVRSAVVYWGPTGSGKSRRAFEEAGIFILILGEFPYVKCSRTKWWTGYKDQENVVIDEFRGSIAIDYLLRWLDRYPCSVETKGGSRNLMAKRFWFTSNLHPREWYKDIDEVTYAALERRLEIVEIT